MNIVGQLIELVLGTFIVLLFVRLIVDWIQMFARSWVPRGPVLVILEGVYTITDPPVKALRKVIPPLRLGGVAIDLSFIAVLLICYILLSLNRQILLWSAAAGLAAEPDLGAVLGVRPPATAGTVMVSGAGKHDYSDRKGYG